MILCTKFHTQTNPYYQNVETGDVINLSIKLIN